MKLFTRCMEILFFNKYNIENDLNIFFIRINKKTTKKFKQKNTLPEY